MRCAFCLPFLGNHIAAVLFWRPKEQVVGVDASFVVAGVANKFAAWNFSAKNLPCRPVCSAAVPALKMEAGVSIRCVACGPKPTARHWYWRDFFHEPREQCFHLVAFRVVILRLRYPFLPPYVCPIIDSVMSVGGVSAIIDALTV